MQDFCKCASPLKTLWEKEVLLMRTEIKVPAFKDGYAYRLLVSGRSHVKAGDGNDVWINGQQIKGFRGFRDSRSLYTASYGESKNPPMKRTGKREGNMPMGLLLSKEVRESIKDGKIQLSISGFLNYEGGKKANRQSFWFEEMKIPEPQK